jgi:thiamine-phosphate pyrophosphorylase
VFVTTSRLPPLYVVTDRHQTGEDRLLRILGDIIPEQGMMVQIRERDLGSRELLRFVEAVHRLAHPFRVPWLINDRVDLVLATQAAGVHLRSDSMPTKEARKCLGAGYLIGKSVHSAEEALQSEKEGADFVVLGPVYETPSKRQYGPPLGVPVIREASRHCTIPVYAIGGMTPSRVENVMASGAAGVAVVSSIFQAASPREAVTTYSTQLRKWRPR